MIIELIRDDDPTQSHNFGKLFVDKLFFGETLEDMDRHIESGGGKEYGDTAIHAGGKESHSRHPAALGESCQKSMTYLDSLVFVYTAGTLSVTLLAVLSWAKFVLPQEYRIVEE